MSRKTKVAQRQRNLLLEENFSESELPRRKDQLDTAELLREIAELTSRLETVQEKYDTAASHLAATAPLKRNLAVAERQVAELTTRNSELRKDILRLHKKDSEMRQLIARLQRELEKLQARHPRRSRTAAYNMKIHSIYKKLVSKYHPDRDTTKAEVMTDINELYQAMTVSG